MANKGGTLANLGQALSGYGSALSGNPMYLQNSLLLRQAQQQQQQQEQAQRQEQVSNIASRSLMRGGPMTDENKAGLLRLAAPQAFNSALAQQAMQQLFPAKPTAQVLKPGETLGLTSADGQFTPTYTAPSEAKVEKPPAEIEIAKWLFGGDEAAAREYIKGKNAPKQEGSWRTLTPAEAQQMNLNPSGSYQVNDKGQIQVITQPKQDAPTETQSKYAYNAKRVADGLKTVNAVLEKDKGASSSWWLNATTDSLASNYIPGISELGRATASDNSQIVRNNMADVVDAVITLGTGAAYTQEQLKAARNSFLPQPGESQKVKQDKFRKLASIYEQARANARTAGQDLPDISQFGSLFGLVDDGGPAMSRENDPLGIRGR